MDLEHSDDVTFKIQTIFNEKPTEKKNKSTNSKAKLSTNGTSEKNQIPPPTNRWIVNKDIDQSGRFTHFQEFKDPEDKGKAEEFLADPVAYYENLRQSDDVKVFISCGLFIAIVLAVFVLMFTLNPAM